MNIIKNFFFGVPTKSGVNDYTLEEGSVFLGSEKIGDVEYIADDTCDSTYSRKDGKVLVLNSRSKGSCVGCDFCHTFQQTPNDDLYFEDDELIPYSIDRWLEGNERDDLSHLEQISILTGCFGSEDEVLDHIDLVRRIAPTYGFNNEILYYGSELRSENALKKLADLGPIEFCLSLECFDYRKKILAPQKRDLTLSDAKKILELSNSLGMNTRFSYILGLEPLDTLAQHMQEFLPLINHIPVINIFQPHTLEKRDLITPEAEKLEYFLDGRKILEKLFIPANLKPNTWENYRSPWFLSFR